MTSLTELRQSVSHLGERMARIEGNQQAILTTDATAYRHIARSLTDQHQTLSRIEAGQHQHTQMIGQVLQSHGRITGTVESLHHTLSAAQDEAPPAYAYRIMDKVLEWGPKLLSNWAPISAAVAAAYKWGLPYLRHFLGWP